MPLRNTRHKRRLLWLLQQWQQEHPTRPVSLVQLAQELGTTRRQVRTLYDELAAAHELPPVSKRGFASMARDARTRIATTGGRRAQVGGKAHRYTSEEARRAGKIGGRRNRKRLA